MLTKMINLPVNFFPHTLLVLVIFTQPSSHAYSGCFLFYRPSGFTTHAAVGLEAALGKPTIANSLLTSYTVITVTQLSRVLCRLGEGLSPRVPGM